MENGKVFQVILTPLKSIHYLTKFQFKDYSGLLNYRMLISEHSPPSSFITGTAIGIRKMNKHAAEII